MPWEDLRDDMRSLIDKVSHSGNVLSILGLINCIGILECPLFSGVPSQEQNTDIRDSDTHCLNPIASMLARNYEEIHRISFHLYFVCSNSLFVLIQMLLLTTEICNLNILSALCI